jgi:hypothetical protein
MAAAVRYQEQREARVLQGDYLDGENKQSTHAVLVLLYGGRG